MTRPLDVRVAAFRDSLRSQADQLDEVVRCVLDVDPTAYGVQAIVDSTKLFRIVANDLQTLLDGDELSPFRIEGTIPDWSE
jgi:hypothetical protein